MLFFFNELMNLFLFSTDTTDAGYANKDASTTGDTEQQQHQQQ